MSTFLAATELFCAFAIAQDADTDVLRRGTHVRLLPAPSLGFPLAPFVLWPMRQTVTSLPVDWTGPGGGRVDPPDFGAAGGELVGSIRANPADDGRVVAVQAIPGVASSLRNIQALDGSGRLVVERSAARFTVAAPTISHMRLLGQGHLEALTSYVVTPAMLLEAALAVGTPPEEHILSLPIEDRPNRWYVNGRGAAPALDRVRFAAPRQFTPPDRPDGPFDPLTPDAEMARLASFRQDIDDRLAAMFADRAAQPWSVVTRQERAANLAAREARQTVDFPSRAALLLQGLDPGLGRYLGLMTLLRDLPADDSPTVWAAAGVFALDRRLPATKDRKVGHVLPEADGDEARLLARMIAIFPHLGELATDVRSRGLEVRALMTAVAAAPAPDPPRPPLVRLGDATWRREPAGTSFRFRQTFAVDEPPFVTLTALGRHEPAGWITRHRVVDLAPGSDPTRRAVPMFLGTAPRPNPPGPIVGLVTDEDLSAEGAPWLYRLRLGDLFGRYGQQREISVPTPARPKPPRPSMQILVHPNGRAGDDGPAPFGRLEVNVPVPETAELAAGSRAIASVEVRLAGATHPALPGPDRVARFMLDLPTLLPMEQRRLNVEARFFDDAGDVTPDPPDSSTVEVIDPRPPKVIPTGAGIIWTSSPGPAEEVELRLTFPGEAGARYRAYLADAAGLGLPLTNPGPPERPLTRAEIAVDGFNRARARLLDGMRGRFRLLTEPPLETSPGGRVVLTERLPRSLGTVQFLRVVPVGPTGAEADFDACASVAVAVPSARRPPAPRVDVAVDAAGIATITVDAVGIDLVRLRAAEPSLFDAAPAADVRRPTFRLRRASGFDPDPTLPGAAAAHAPDPLYAREVGRGDMRVDTTGDDPARVVATFVDAAAPLLAFVRYVYWADVRLPPERRLPSGVVEVPPGEGVRPVEPRQVEDAPGAFSLASPPVTAMHVPADPPAIAPAGARASLTANLVGKTYSLAFDLTDGPTVNARAVGSYQLKLWVQEADQAITTTGARLAVSDGRATFRSTPIDFAGAAPPAVTLHAALVDPLGRTGPILAIPATPAP